MKHKLRIILITITLAIALAIGVGTYQAKRAEAKPYTYCTAWQWMTQPGWCAWWVTCGPLFWVNIGGTWYHLDYCGNQYA